MNILIYDTETTGLPKNYAAPSSDTSNWPRLVQLSFIFTDGKDRKEFDFIVKPNGFTIPEEASAIHGISQDIAIEKGQSRDFVLGLFRGFIHSSDMIVAHNMDFDRKIVGAEYHRMFGDMRFDKHLDNKKTFCTMKNSTDIVGIKGTHAGQNKWPKLVELYKHFFGETFDGAHNSMNDARACERCFFELAKLNKDILN